MESILGVFGKDDGRKKKLSDLKAIPVDASISSKETRNLKISLWSGKDLNVTETTLPHILRKWISMIPSLNESNDRKFPGFVHVDGDKFVIIVNCFDHAVVFHSKNGIPKDLVRFFSTKCILLNNQFRFRDFFNEMIERSEIPLDEALAGDSRCLSDLFGFDVVLPVVQLVAEKGGVEFECYEPTWQKVRYSKFLSLSDVVFWSVTGYLALMLYDGFTVLPQSPPDSPVQKGRNRKHTKKSKRSVEKKLSNQSGTDAILGSAAGSDGSAVGTAAAVGTDDVVGSAGGTADVFGADVFGADVFGGMENVD